MEWVLLVSLQWVVAGTPTSPTTDSVVLFPSEDRCRAAAAAVRDEISKPIQNVTTYGRVVCLQRKDK